MSNKTTELELLAPAKNLEYGIEAIDCGADAVYIGADRFGARYAAGNSIEDIAKLIKYAHQFGVRVYATLNTLLFDNELDDARKLAIELCEVGIDALIVQDMAYMMFDLPVALHASTQTATHNIERVKFLDSVGFDRIVVERALDLDTIQEICRESSAEIEVFVHGAICVSYSGACYMGHIVSQRSGNRGVCSQPCRSMYNLYDQTGKLLLKDRHLLSVKDLKLSQHIGKLIECGVKSFKIEGRLKDITYLKNTVRHYREKIDSYIANSSNYVASSVGEVVGTVDIDLNKSFTRGFSDYFILGRQGSVASFHTAKAIGEYCGKVSDVGQNYFVLDKIAEFAPGDGICFVGADGQFTGTNINGVDEKKIFPNKLDAIERGVKIYRNFDIKYLSRIEKHKFRREIAANIDLSFENDKLILRAKDETGCTFEKIVDIKGFELPKNSETMQQNIIKQFQKSGDTIFKIAKVSISGNPKFIPISKLNELRRELLWELSMRRREQYKTLPRTVRTTIKQSRESLTYKENITNTLSEQFYRECGYENIVNGVELMGEVKEGCEAMTMRYCLREELGECLKLGGKPGRLFLENNRTYFEIITMCDSCEMRLIYRGKNYFKVDFKN